MSVAGRPVRTILVVDDSRASLGVFAQRLGERGYLTALAERGGDALDLIAGRGFDLVLLDMVMPAMTGAQVLAEIRGRSETADLPVIVVTAQNDPASVIAALAAGADDHVAKPCDFDVLAARIDRVLARSRRIGDLKRSNAALDARIAARAMELGETRAELAEAIAERQRLTGEMERLRAA